MLETATHFPKVFCGNATEHISFHGGSLQNRIGRVKLGVRFSELFDTLHTPFMAWA